MGNDAYEERKSAIAARKGNLAPAKESAAPDATGFDFGRNYVRQSGRFLPRSAFDSSELAGVCEMVSLAGGYFGIAFNRGGGGILFLKIGGRDERLDFSTDNEFWDLCSALIDSISEYVEKRLPHRWREYQILQKELGMASKPSVEA